MPVNGRKTDVLYKLEKLIANGKRVLIVYQNDREILELLRVGIRNRNTTDIKIWQSLEEASDYVLQSDIDEVLEINRMYDFSDKIAVISDSAQYGSLFNYVKTGIMTKEEMVETLLYKM